LYELTHISTLFSLTTTSQQHEACTCQSGALNSKQQGLIMKAMEQSASNDLQTPIKPTAAAPATTAATADDTVGIDTTALEECALPVVGSTAATTATTAADTRSVKAIMKRSDSSVRKHGAVTDASSTWGDSIVAVDRESAADQCSVALFATVTAGTASSEKPHIQVYFTTSTL
jgi:hypothetical protein